MVIRTRRAFLGEAITASLAGSVLARSTAFGASASAPRKMTMDLVCAGIGLKVTQVEANELAHRHGFESVHPDAKYLGKFSDNELQAILADMKQKGLAWGAAFSAIDFRKDDAAFRAGMKGLGPFAKGLRRAGVKRVGTWLIWGDDRLTYLQQMKTFGGRLREMAKVFKDNGLRFGLEYVGTKIMWSNKRYPWVHTMAETRELISEINMDNVGLVLDSWHWYHAGETAEDIGRLKNEDVIAVDVNDAPKGIAKDQMIDNARELPCATGVIALADFMNALKQIGYDGPVRAEPFSKAVNAMPKEEAVTATVKSLKKAFSLIK